MNATDATERYFAQFGEDRILDEIFKHRGEGICVEVGAIPEFMKGKGYLIFNRTGVNDWYAMEGDHELIPAGKKEFLLKDRNRIAFEYRLGQRFAPLLPYIPGKLKPFSGRFSVYVRINPWR